MVELNDVKEVFPDVEDDIIVGALETIDQSAILNEELGKLEVVIWNKVDNVHGVSADDILSDKFYKKSNVIYLINREGVTINIQPYNTNESVFVPMDENEATLLG